MILIVTHKEDFTADFLINKLNTKGIAYFRFNCEDLASISYRFNTIQSYSSIIDSKETFESVWFRRTKLPELPVDNLSKNEINYLYLEYDGLLNNILQSISAKKWLSHPTNIGRAENKLLQLKTANQLGFNVPPTMVSNSAAEVLAFFDCIGDDIIIKPLKHGKIRDGDSSRYIYSNRLRKEHIAGIKEFDLTPCIFQKYVPKDYELRITVVDNQVFSSKVRSQEDELTKVDWRRKKLKFELAVIPDDISQKCKALVNALGLSFGAIDMIKSIDGEYYFLEINPNGQWAWIEIDTGLSISDAIINFLDQ